MYEANTIIILKTINDELIFDELDEDFISVAPLKPKTVTRSTNKGRIVGSSIPRVPYELKITIPPTTEHLTLAQNFYNKWNQMKKPKLSVTIIETLDYSIRTTKFDQGVFVTEIEQDSYGSETMPKFSFALNATKITTKLEDN